MNDHEIAQRVASRFVKGRQTIQDDIDTVVEAIQGFCKKHKENPPGWPGSDSGSAAAEHWGPNTYQPLKKLKLLINRSKLQAPQVENFLEVGKGMEVRNPLAALKWIDADSNTRSLEAFERILRFLGDQPKSALG